MLELGEDEKITSHRSDKKGEANKLRVEAAKELLKQKALAGELGTQAQSELLRIQEVESISQEVNNETQKI